MVSKIFLFLLTTTLFASPPSWYVKNNIKCDSCEYVGYGEGSSKEVAKKVAKADIANSLQTTINVSSELKRSSKNDNYDESFKQNIKESSTISLDGLELLKSAYVDGLYYVAIKYVNLPFAKKVRMKFDDVSKIQRETNSYLKSTLLLNELKAEFGFYPKVIISKGNLTIANKSFRIKKDILKKLFSSYDSKDLELNIPTNLKTGEFYFVDINTKSAGYLTLIQVYENGETAVLFSNKKVTKNTKLEYPNKDIYNGLQTYLTKKQTKAKDLTMAIICKDKKGFDYFDSISITKDKYAKVYGKIFDMIDRCSVSSQVMKIRR